MNTRQRIENLERVIPVNLPPCLPEVACRVFGLYIRKTGLNPTGYWGDFAFAFGVVESPNLLDASRYFPLKEEEEAFYQANLQKAILYWQGAVEGKW